jgi:diadenosine tetraphosphate (Ap4A) HIT family hydrolase
MLGNLVPQLHIHIIARREGDPAWPGPVWGHSEPVPYDWNTLSSLTKSLQNHMN